jgi:nitric oxide reductase large subunit
MEQRGARSKKERNNGWKFSAGLIMAFSLCLICAGLYFVTLQIERTLWYPRTAFFSADMSRTSWNFRFLGMDFCIVFHDRE